MKPIYFFLLCLIPLFGFSQCPTSAITLSSQAEVDAFATNYPGCTELQNTLTISGADIVDLTPLAGITYISYLRISNNPLLTQLNGLHNLQSAVPNSTTLYLDDNPLLNNLSAFTGITFLNGLKINGCSSLTNLEGLNFVTDFEETQYVGLTITNNLFLTDISALTNISSLDNSSGLFSMRIDHNPVLSSLNGLQGFNSDYEYLSIRNNDALVDLTGLSNNFGVYETCYIEDNDALLSFNGIVDFWANEINIRNNLVLIDVSAFNNSSGYPPALIITDNPNLAICNNAIFCGSITEINDCCGGSHPNFLIDNNLPGCNSIPEIALSCGLAPVNDECEDALPLIIGQTTQAYNENGTASSQVPSCNDTNRVDVWFEVNSGAFTTMDILVETGYSLQLWEGNCSSLSQVANACAEGSLNDILVTSNTNYYVQVWSCANCRMATGLFDILVQDGTLSSPEFAFENFSMYPNPVNQVLKLKGKAAIETVSIYNLLGQQVLVSQPKSMEAKLNMSSLQPGIYLVKVTIGAEVATYKIIKE